MRYTTLLVLLITLSQSLLGNGELSLSTDTGGLERKRGLLYFNNQLFSGYTYELHLNGNTKSKTHWVNGQRDGKQISWYEDGQMKALRIYKNHRKHGLHQGWYHNGSLRFEYQFAEGVYHGSYKEWYSDGSPASERNYIHGNESGAQKVYELNGQVRANYVVKDGHRYGLVGSKNCITSPTSQL